MPAAEQIAVAHGWPSLRGGELRTAMGTRISPS